jgi:hypothetical protein
MKILHPRRGDILPVPLELQKFDPEWCWIYHNAILIAAGAHDLVIVLRLIRFGEMPPLWIHRLLRHVFLECKERGFLRFLIFLNDDPDEQKLREIAHRRYGAHFEPFRGDVVIGAL